MASSPVKATSSGANGDETKSSSSKLDVLLKKLHNTADSSTDGTASDSKSQKSSGSSRRKPKVTRKVVESAEDDSDGYEYMNTPSRMNGNSSPRGKKGEENGIDPLDSTTVDADGNEVLADGTMVVQPEAVVEKKSCSKGHESRKDRKPRLDDLGIVSCTSCRKQVNPSIKNAVNRHPVLKVLICKACYEFYTSDDFGQDSDGMDNQCRWCGEGGNLIVCDYCHNAFCKSCIRRNFGRAALTELEADDGKWRCYVCNSKPLKKLVKDCDSVLRIIEERKEKRLSKSSVTDKTEREEPSRVTERARGSPSKGAKLNLEITADNVVQVMSRLTAAATSFTWLVESLEDDVKKDDNEEIRVNTVVKLKRGVTAFGEMFSDIENYAKESARKAKTEKRVRISLGKLTGEKKPSKKLSLPKKSLRPVSPTDIISIEGSSEDELVLGEKTKKAARESGQESSPEAPVKEKPSVKKGGPSKNKLTQDSDKESEKATHEHPSAGEDSEKSVKDGIKKKKYRAAPKKVTEQIPDEEEPMEVEDDKTENKSEERSSDKAKSIEDQVDDPSLEKEQPGDEDAQTSMDQNEVEKPPEDNSVKLSMEPSQDLFTNDSELEGDSEKVEEEGTPHEEESKSVQEQSASKLDSDKEEKSKSVHEKSSNKVDSEEEKGSKSVQEQSASKLDSDVEEKTESVHEKEEEEKESKSVQEQSSVTMDTEEKTICEVSDVDESEPREKDPEKVPKECDDVHPTGRSPDKMLEDEEKDNLVETYKDVLSRSLENEEYDNLDADSGDNSSHILSEPESKSSKKKRSDSKTSDKSKGTKSAKKSSVTSDDEDQQNSEDSNTEAKRKKRKKQKASPSKKREDDSDSVPEFISSKGKGKGKNSPEAVRERQLKLKLRKSKEGDSSLHVVKNSDEDNAGSSSKSDKTKNKDCPDGKSSESEAPVRSAADINAQLSMHREMMSDSSDDEAENPEPDDGPSSSKSDSESAGSDYTPGQKSTPKTKKSSGRVESARKKTQDKFSELRKKQEQMKKRKLEKEKERKRRERQRSREMDSDSSDEEEEDNKKAKKKSPKKKPSKDGKKLDSSDSSDFKESKKKTKKSSSGKSPKSAKKNSEGKADDSAASGDDKKSPKLKVLKIKIERLKEASDSSNYDSALEADLAGLESLPRGRSKKAKKDKSSKGKDAETSKPSKPSEANKDSPDKSPRQKKKERAEKRSVDIDALGSDESNADDDGDEEMEVDKVQLDEDEEEKMLQLKAEEEERLARTRKELLNSESSMDDDSSDLSDNDEAPKKAKEKQKNGTAESADESDVAPKTKPKRLRQNKLLNAKLSDSGSEDDTGKKKKKKADDEDFALSDEAREDDAEDEDDEDVDDDDLDEDSGDKKSKKNDAELSDDSDFEDTKKKKKKKKKKAGSEDEEESDGKSKKGKGKRKRKRIKAPSSTESETADSEAPKPKKKKRKKKGEESDLEDSDVENTPGKKRRNIKKIMKDKKLSQDTKDAAKAEQERRRRLKEKQKLYNQIEEEDKETGQKNVITTNLTLEVDSDDEPLIEVHKEIVNKLKPHQVEAVQFLWDNLVEDMKRLEGEHGSGCILAHCMGLGKTLSMITFIHTLLVNEDLTRCRTCVVVCPLNTVLNWVNEFEKWVPEDASLNVYEMTTVKDNWGRMDTLRTWQDGGGILIMGYEMYRNLSQSKRVRNKKHKKAFFETLVDPGPDLVVCDEGHILKNDKSSTSIAMNAVRTKRRVVLTGTPLQNNLTEYHCMVDFVKPSLLGSRKEFCNRFVNPITNGQCADASKWDVKLMKKRAHVLHETLAGCVQRKDYSALTKFLPPKNEYILSIRLSTVQCDLYQKYLEIVGRAGTLQKGDVRGASLFSDYQSLSRIWTHPWIMKLHEIREQNKRTFDDEDSFLDDESEGDDSFIDDEESDLSDPGWKRKKKNKDKDNGDSDEKKEEPKAGTSSGKRGSDRDSDVEIVKKWNTRSRGKEGSDDDGKVEEETNTKLSNEWWADYFTEEDQYKLELSGKLMILAELLKMCEAIGDKVLVFSQSLLSLDLIEDFLEHWDKAAKPENPEEQVAGVQSWIHGSDYFRMDGSTSSALRKRWSEIFNDRENTRARLFLISTKAGSLGTNMVGANRCIIFDASWNPTHDVQSIFRVYRFGQIKPVYIYRFLAQGTMEEKIYERQVTKQSLSCRVVDEHQIERHFTTESLQELYNFTPDRLDDPDRKERPLPALPKDRLLAELLSCQKDWIVNYHEHDSLLENQVDEELTEEERKAAWEEYEQEKKGIIRQVANANFMPPQRMYPQQFGNMGMGQNPAMNSISMFPHLTEVARAIRSANPNISMAELQQRLEHYMRLQMASQQQALYQQQQMQRYGGMQYNAGSEPGEVTFLGYGQQSSRSQPQQQQQQQQEEPPPQSVTAPNLYNVLNGSKKE